MSPEPSAAGRFRPPDNFLPAHAQNATRRAAGEPEIFLSWGGAIYGPARADEVAAGVRTSWFEKETLFWFEGQTEWRPVDEFPQLHEGGHHTLAARRIGTPPDEAPPLPPRGSRSAARPSGAKTRYAGRRSAKSGSSRRKRGRGRPSKLGRLLVFGVILLGVALTVALLFLLMQM